MMFEFKCKIILLTFFILSCRNLFSQEKVELQPDSVRTIHLKEVTITQKKDRFTQKGDTLVINLHDDDTRPHASSLTLFDRVQGLDVGFGGNLSIRGKNIQKVTIDGKTIFGGVAVLSLDNIRADMIERMEYVETEDASGKKQNTLNLILKADRKNGGYGDLAIGIGVKSRYYSKGSYSKITNNGFINVFSSANNINQKGIDTKTVDRLLIANFINSINRSSSVIGLYEPRKESFRNDLNRLSNNLIGINKLWDSGINYTFQRKKIEFNSFVYSNINQEFNNQSSISNSVFGSLIQTATNKSNKSDATINLIGNSYLTWKITDKISVRFSEQINFRKGNSNNLSTVLSTLNNGDLPVLNTHFDRTSTLDNSNNFYLSGVIKGKRPGVVSSIYFQNLINFMNDTISFKNKGNNFEQNQLIDRTNKGQLNSLQLTHSKPISQRILLEARIKQVSDSRKIIQNTFQRITNENSIQNNEQNYDMTEISIFGLYKMRKVTFVTGVAYWRWDLYRKKTDEVVSNSPSFIINPFTKVEFKLSDVKFGLKYAKEPVLPSWSQTLNIADSSDIYAITSGNPFLRFYTQNGFDFNLETGVKNGYRIDFQASYKRLNNYVIFSNIYLPLYGVFSSTYINSKPTSNQFNANFSIFRINPSSNLSWYMSAVYAQQDIFQAVDDSLALVKSNTGLANFNVTWKLNNRTNIVTQFKSQINVIQGNLQTANYIISRINLELGKKSFLDTQARLQLNQSAKWQFQSFFDLECGTYLFKNNSVQISLLTKNLLNKKNEISIFQNDSANLYTFNSILPFSAIGKLTFYPESWYKK